MSDVIIAKCVSIAIIFAGSLVCGLLPAFRVFSAFPRFALSLILSYGGGILIATSLVHILPEARELWPDIRFTPEMSLCVGIFIVYFIEEVAHFLVCHDLHSPLGHGLESGDGHNHGVHIHHEEPPNRCDEPAAVYLFAKDSHTSRSGDYSLSNNSHSHNHCHSHSHQHHHHTSVELEQQVKLFPVTTSNNTNATSSEDKSHISVSPKKDQGKIVAHLRSLVGLVALSVHAGLEGLSVGLGRKAGDVWYLCGAIAAHKLVIAFCLGMEVRNASSSPCTLVTTSSSAAFKFRYVLFFALMTPMGIAIGTIITEIVHEPNEQTENTLVAVLQTLASGTLLYVAFFEVVLRERARFSGKGLAQLAFVVLGFATMCLVEIFIGGHDHSGKNRTHIHDHDDHHDIDNATVVSALATAVLSTAAPDNLID
ncbi:Zinc transporter ZIP1 [Orchesella cincta]|uniref:Zinc transporter ZIP1 n=1 Tax=Orchesella cincta TaxID=48709 RepID=A0A1D2NGV7_ORCCI|nr:Zinc transporter ZIP1 [Orchesella cincta]